LATINNLITFNKFQLLVENMSERLC